MPQKRTIRFFAPEDMPEATAVRGFGLTQDFAPHVHARYVLGLCEQGRRMVYFASGEYAVGSGELFLIPPRTAHRCLCDSEHAYRIICFSPDLLPADIRHQPVFQDQELAAAIRQLQQAFEAAESLQSRRKLLKHILRTLHERHRLDCDSILPAERRAIQCVRAYIHDHFAEKLGLEIFADVAGLSACHLQRIFRKEVGISPQAYLARHRVRQAARMLQLGEAHAETALACGFTDQSHLIRVFKRYCGLSPQNYLLQNKGNGLP